MLRRTTCRLAVPATVALLAAPVCTWAVPMYTFMDLGDRGSTVTKSTAIYASTVRGINDSGTVVGEAFTSSTAINGYVGGPPMPTSGNGVISGFLNVDDTARAINNSGLVTGRIQTVATGLQAANSRRAYRYDSTTGVQTLLPGPNANGLTLRSIGMDINDNGRVVGGAFNSSISYHSAGFWDGTTFTAITMASGVTAGPRGLGGGVNASGQIVGVRDASTNGTGPFKPFITDANGQNGVFLSSVMNNNGWANDINASGVVVGGQDQMAAWVNGGTTAPFVWKPDTANGLTSTTGIQAMAQPAGYMSGQAMAVNDAGFAVGLLNLSTNGTNGESLWGADQWWQYFDGYGAFLSNYDAFIWDTAGSTSVNLQDYLYNVPAGIDLLMATDINNSGQITVLYRDTLSATPTVIRSAVLVAIPEPSVLGGGALLMGWALRRRRR